MSEREPSSPAPLQIFVRREDPRKLSFEVHSEALGLHNKDFGSVPLEGDAKVQAQEELGRRVDDLSDLAAQGERGQESARLQLSVLAMALFQKLPDRLRELLWAQQGQVAAVQILSDEPYIPWELLKLQGEGGEAGPFLCEAFQVTRWLREARQDGLELPLQRIAFVCPTGSDLPSAAGERADLLALVGPERVIPIVPALAEVTTALLTGNYDGWHFTGHGLARAVDPNGAAFWLDENDQLTAESLGAAAGNLRRLRPIFFFNACDTGRGGFSLTGLGGWAQQSLKAGAGAFLGTLWPVRDQKARTFARTFYEQFLAGETFGEAVRQARLKVREEFPGDPAWLAYTVYGHPHARALFGAREPHRPVPARVPDVIHSRIQHFNWLISRKTQGFIGRSWLFDRIDRFVQSERSGYAILLGEPGIGKTAVMAEMVKRRGYPHHFNVRRQGIQTAHEFLTSLCAQLIVRFGLEDRELPPGGARDAGFLAGFLERVSARLKSTGERLVLLVDALDESETGPVLRGANPLYLPVILPANIFFVVSSRPTTTPLFHQEAEHRILLDQEDGNRADIRLYLESWLPRDGIRAHLAQSSLEAGAFVDQLAGLSLGNFMYLYYVLPEIEKGFYRDRTLPAGLERYYEDHWDLLRTRDRGGWRSTRQPILGALAAARGPVGVSLLAKMSGAGDPAIVLAALEEWEQFIEIVPQPGSGERLYQLYHESFREFLEKKIDLGEASRRADEALWDGMPEP